MKPTEQIVNVEFKDHDKIVLTNSEGDTYTSKSEELMDFFTRSHGEAISQMQPEWVSVEDRLPEIGIEVLVFRPSSQKWGDKQITIDYMVKSQRYDPDQILHSWSRIWNATHWMPLPNPPKSV